jgi:hypothetical protein
MRTLVDLLNTEDGYARIVYEQDSYGYQLHAYQPASMPDLFERMSGYTCVVDACEAAQHQLSAMGSRRKAKARNARQPGNRGSSARAARPANRRRNDGGSMGLL